MISENINKMIMEAMKEHNLSRTEVLRSIKAAFLNWQTAKENAGKQMTESDEINVIKKMVKQREESKEQYLSAGRHDLANAESYEIMALKEFLPAEATEADIEKAFEEIRTSGDLELIKANMGLFVKSIKALLPTANGKLVAQIVSSKLS